MIVGVTQSLVSFITQSTEISGLSLRILIEMCCLKQLTQIIQVLNQVNLDGGFRHVSKGFQILKQLILDTKQVFVYFIW